MAFDYFLQLGRVNRSMRGKRIAFVAHDEVEVRLDARLGRGRGGSDTEDMESARRNLGGGRLGRAHESELFYASCWRLSDAVDDNGRKMKDSKDERGGDQRPRGGLGTDA